MANTTPTTLNTLSRLLDFLKPHWRWFAIGLILSISLALLWMLPAYITSLLIDKAIPSRDTSLLVRLTLATLGAGILLIALEIAETYFLERAGQCVMTDIRTSLFDSVQSQSYRFFVNNDAGAISARMWGDISEAQILVSSTLIQTASSALLLIASLAFMLAWNWELTLIIMALWPIAFAIAFFIGRMRERVEHAFTQWFDDNAEFVYDRLNIDGSILLNGVGYDRQIDSRRFRNMIARFQDLSMRRGMGTKLSIVLALILPLVGSAIIYLYGGLGAVGNETSVGVLVAFTALSLRLSTPIGDLASFQIELAASLVHLRRIFEWIDLEPEVRDAPDAIELPAVNGLISVKNASVDYRTGKPIIDNLSHDFQPGKMTAIVGRSGAGKTTLTHLILRFYDPNTGVVELDGNDLRSVKLSSLRKHLSLVPQDSAVFNTSVRENLLVASPAASEGDMIGACKAAQLHDLLDRLPDGYDTVVGELGYRLSGGERQRLAIARVILKQPGIVILDEPTSSLDGITERAIKDALDSALLKNATAIVIAHRLSTILSADEIIVLDEGSIVASGSHRQLMDNCDLYCRLYEEQFAHQDQLAEQPVPANP